MWLKRESAGAISANISNWKHVDMIDGQYFIPDDAGDAAAQLADWRTRWPGMGVLALVAEASKHRIAALQAACREVDVPLLGPFFRSWSTAMVSAKRESGCCD
jgi:hypothetical protein